ncbi:MAG TPA: MBL fold metallo-hydrolase [Candidatus Caccovivens faecavium]|nr:MBL fold metallo-hydrolase [Candidatus Caccovivens faecavium]
MIKLIWYGTATIMLDIDGEKLLFDPFFRRNKKLEQPDIKEFCEADFIFNTHAHFDHLCDVPAVLSKSKAKLYGSRPAYLRLKKQGVDVEKKAVILKHYETRHINDISIKVIPSKHVKNDIGIILLTALKILFAFQIHNAIKLLSMHHKFLMGGEIMAFEVKAHDKKILIFGSAGIDKTAKLPKDVDVLVWPFQGRINMSKYSLPIIEKIKPKVIILDHFDNAFPPVTSNVKTEKFMKLMKKKDIKVILPKYKEEIIID